MPHPGTIQEPLPHPVGAGDSRRSPQAAPPARRHRPRREEGAVRAAGAPAIATKVQRSLIGLQVLVVGVYLIGLLWPRPEWDGLTNSWLSWISQSIPALICWSALPTAGVRRIGVALLAVGL